MNTFSFTRPAALLAVLLLVLLAGCTGARPVTLEGQERDDVLAKAEPIADNLFAAIDARDAESFTRDFDEGMQKAITSDRINDIFDSINTKVGKYQSRQVTRVEKVGEHYAVIYSVDYEQEADVSFRVVLTQSEPAQVSGLWYDSPKLRAK